MEGMGSGKLNVFPFVRFFNLYDDPKEEYPLNLTKEMIANLWIRWGCWADSGRASGVVGQRTSNQAGYA